MSAVLTITYRNDGYRRTTDHANHAEARRELVRLTGAMRYTRDGDGTSGTLTAGEGLQATCIGGYRID